jgi:hypothetical protein
MVERGHGMKASVNMTIPKAMRVPPSSRAARNARYAESEMEQWLGHLLRSAIGFITNGHQRGPPHVRSRATYQKCHFLRARNPGSSSVALGAGNDDILPDRLRRFGVGVRPHAVHEGRGDHGLAHILTAVVLDVAPLLLHMVRRVVLLGRGFAERKRRNALVVWGHAHGMLRW